MRRSQPHGNADGDFDTPPSKLPRSAIACQRCKQRKQRCDNGFPSCGNCTGAGETANCVYGVKNVIYPPEYVTSLESQIATLERRLQARESETQDEATGARQESSSTSPANLSPETVEIARTPDNVAGGDLAKLLEAGTGIATLSSNHAYLGASSGAPLAKIIQSSISRSVVQMSQGKAIEEGSTLNDGPQKTGDEGTLFTARAPMPRRPLADKLLMAYIHKVHSKHPFLSRSKLRRLNICRLELQPAEDLPRGHRFPVENRLDWFMLHMVYAIGARYLQLSRDTEYVSAEAHYASALLDIDEVLDVQSLVNVQCMLLLALYQLRSPSGPGLWSMIGVVMRHCLDGGLHRKSNLPLLLDQQRKRLFWTVYMLERSVARTLGRPCSVTDREIDVELPANVSDEIEDESELLAATERSLQYPYEITAMSPAIHIVRVQRIESAIHRALYRVDKPITATPPYKVAQLRAQLEAWKDRIWDVIPPAAEDEVIPYNMSEYHMIQYYKGTLLLLLPFLPSLAPMDPDFRLCAFAAGQVCQLYKLLHDKQQYISYSLLALHASFVAGLVMVYCFSMDRSIFDSNFSSDIRACSTVLYIIAERWPATRKVKNAFESLVSATIEGGSSHRQNEIGKSAMSMLPTGNSSGNGFPSALPSAANAQQAYGEIETTSDVWDLFETVLDERDHSFRWTQEGIFNAMNAFPEYCWSL
jgi:hypothetical protein